MCLKNIIKKLAEISNKKYKKIIIFVKIFLILSLLILLYYKLHILKPIKSFIDDINDWNIIIASALGPFLAIILSAIGFLIRSSVNKKRELKENLRRIEISTTRSLNDTNATHEKMKAFILRLDDLKNRIKDTQDFSLDWTNYPIAKNIYRDENVSNFKIKSYYLHNKILINDAMIKEMNEMITEFKNYFYELQRQNEIQIALIRQNTNPDPEKQKKAYIKNIDSFKEIIQNFIKYTTENIKIMVQIKVYNDKMRKKNKYWVLKREKIEISDDIKSLNKIDKIIEKEVEKIING